jgi:hypothetical protein
MPLPVVAGIGGVPSVLRAAVTVERPPPGRQERQPALEQPAGLMSEPDATGDVG